MSREFDDEMEMPCVCRCGKLFDLLEGNTSHKTKDLICDEWVSKMCKTGGKAFTMSVPVRLNYDTDVVLSALINRFSLANKTIQSLQSEVEQLKGIAEKYYKMSDELIKLINENKGQWHSMDINVKITDILKSK